jgi:hypothetical protein
MATYTPSSDNVMFGRGKILFAAHVGGATSNQYIHLGNCDTFSIGVVPEKVSLTNYMTETSAVYKEVVKKVDIPIKISGFEFASSNMKLVFMGDTTSYTQTAATITGETIATASMTGLKGSFFATTKRSISSPTLIQGTSTLTSGTDYTIEDASRGVIKVLSTGAVVADGTSLLLTYAHAALTGSGALTVVRGGVDTSVEGRLLFLPDNTTGPDNEVQVWNATLTPDGEIPFISDEFAKWNLSGQAQDDSAGTYGGSSSNPYFQVTTR